jgi:ATP-dependent DNA helicase DinG
LIRDAQKLVIPQPEQASELTRALARLAQRADVFWLSLRGVGGDDDWGSGSTSGNDGEHNAFGAGSTRYRRGRERGSPQDLRRAIDGSYFVRVDREGNETASGSGDAAIALSNALARLASALSVVNDPPPELDNIVRRVQSLKFDLEFIVAADAPDFVYWLETRGRGVFLHATPIDVSGILEEKLFAEIHSAVLTSATMTAGRSFTFIKGRLGISHARELIVESHFDFANQSVLYLPRRMPDPRAREFVDASVEEIVKILEATHGRAFVLFTSLASMRETYERVRYRIDFPTFIQGEGSKGGLLERFRTTEGAVLFATSSFWQGVDVQGDALSCVIISKLPFAVPSDPVVAARQKHIDEQGGNSFYEYSVPQAAITLKQGLGRLIRSTTDRGVLSILDPRLNTKSYGRVFLESLPPSRVTRVIEDAAKIFSC